MSEQTPPNNHEAAPAGDAIEGAAAAAPEATAAAPAQSNPPASPSPAKAKKPARKSTQKARAKYYIPVEVGQKLAGKIKTVTDFGAFVDLNMSVDGLVHISELARRRVTKVTDVVSQGEEVTVWVKSIDTERGRIGLTMLKPIERKYNDLKEGEVLEGEVKRIEEYGVFVDIGLAREGLVHVSELAHDFVKIPADVVSVGEAIKVKVLKVDARKKQVNLSIKALLELPEPDVVEEIVEEQAEEDEAGDEPMPTTMAVAFGRLGSGKKAARKKQSKRKKRSKVMDDVVARTLKVGEQDNT